MSDYSIRMEHVRKFRAKMYEMSNDNRIRQHRALLLMQRSEPNWMDELGRLVEENEAELQKFKMYEKWIDGLVDGTLTPDDILIQKLEN